MLLCSTHVLVVCSHLEGVNSCSRPGGYFDRCLDCCLDQARVFDAASCLCSVKCQPKSKTMPRPPKKPKSLEAPNTPLGCTASSSAEEAHRSIDVYLDYNGVLNNGLEFREKLNVFMTRLEHIDVLNQNHSDVVRITLLSYRRYQRGCVHTLQELTEAGVLNTFDNIVFTAARSGTQKGDLVTYRYEPRDRPAYNKHDGRSYEDQRKNLAQHLKLNGAEEREYHWFTGSKDEYIARSHEKACTRIIFADDKLQTLRAVNTRHPYATCIWMQAVVEEKIEDPETLLRKTFRKADRDPLMLHAENLEQLYCNIVAALLVIRENSHSMRAECACFAYLLHVRPGHISD